MDDMHDYMPPDKVEALMIEFSQSASQAEWDSFERLFAAMLEHMTVAPLATRFVKAEHEHVDIPGFMRQIGRAENFVDILSVFILTVQKISQKLPEHNPRQLEAEHILRSGGELLRAWDYAASDKVRSKTIEALEILYPEGLAELKRTSEVLIKNASTFEPD